MRISDMLLSGWMSVKNTKVQGGFRKKGTSFSTMNPQPDFFEFLPDEVVLLIVNKFDSVQDLGRAACVSHRFLSTVSALNNNFWRKLYAKKWLLFEEELELIEDDEKYEIFFFF